jgi:hypothetical protein
MTPAERRFKAAVRALVREGVYPGPVALRRWLGREEGSQTIDGRETVWRRAVLNQMGWTERGIRWRVMGYRAWIPPQSWKGRR